jgi:hypothetical protein
MQVLCRTTKHNAETRCCICGQGFVMFWDRQSNSERKEILFEIQKTLCNHHRNQTGQHVHPVTDFMAPDYFGPFLPLTATASTQAQAQACAQ